MGKRWKRVFLALSMCISVPGLANTKKEVKIAIAGPHTGPNAAFGEQFWRGATQAAKDINAKGGVSGQQIVLVKADDACEPKQAVAVANRLVDQDKVAAVVGHFCSESTMPASEVYADANILMITPASTNPAITERKMKSVMRMCGRDDQQGLVAADFIVKNLKAKRIAIVHDKTTYGRGLAESFKRNIEKLGQKEVLFEGITRGEKDFNALVTKIKAANADLVYYGGVHSEAGLIVQQMRKQGLKSQFFSGDGIISSDFVSAAGGKQNTVGVMATFGPDPRVLPQSKPVVEAFKKIGYEPEGYTLYSYATVEAVAQALAGAKTTSGKDLAAWLEKNGANTIMGKKEWDAKGDLKVADYVPYRWDDKGNYHQIN